MYTAACRYGGEGQSQTMGHYKALSRLNSAMKEAVMVKVGG